MMKRDNDGRAPIDSQKPPGSPYLRTFYSICYLFYGIFILFMNMKMFTELRFFRRRTYDPGDEPKRPGEVVVITGGPRGIAYELAKKFLELDFTVIMGCRDVTSSQIKVDEIRSKGIESGTIHLLQLDLKSLASTKRFAQEVLKKTDRIDLLMNNAGIMMTPYESTKDGYEAQFQVNYLSHFLLTLLLLPTMKRTTGEKGADRSCRIVNTTSVYHLAGSLDFDDLEKRSIYVSPKCYFDSKLCLVLFTKHLERRLQKEKANIHVFAIHPGIIPTDLASNAEVVHRVVASCTKPIWPTPADGADAIMHCALSSKLEEKGGSYFDGLNISASKTEVDNDFLQERLWRRSESLCQGFL